MKNIYHNFYRKIIFNASALSSGTVIMLIQSYGYTLELQYVIHQFTYKQLFIIGQKRQFIVSTGFPVIFHP